MTSFERVTSRHQWAPGALDLAKRALINPPVAKLYEVMARELALPTEFGRERCIVRYRTKKRSGQ